MDYLTIDALRDRHPAWRLLRAGNAPLILSFLGRYFVEDNHGRTAASELASALDDDLYALNQPEVRYPKAPAAYLTDWAEPDAGWLQATYPDGEDELHYNATAAFEKAYQWVLGLQHREFVGAESRLQSLIDLLRQIVHGAETDPQTRLEELHRQRAQLDREIEAAETGHVEVMDDRALRERYQLFSSSARELLSDFREVEENFRGLDRAARERIAQWDGTKGELLQDLIGDRNAISGSDQGRSFEAFYSFLLSSSRQEELTELLSAVQQLPGVETDRRIRTIHHDWFDAAERANVTVRQITEQLRRFLDDQVWLENKRVVELIKAIKAAAIATRDSPPAAGLSLEPIGVPVQLPFERPLYQVKPDAEVNSLIPPATEEVVELDAIFDQQFIDSARLAQNVRAVVPARSAALLTDVLTFYPIEQGVAEIVGYLALAEEDLEVTLDDSQESILDFDDESGVRRRARLPLATVQRR